MTKQEELKGRPAGKELNASLSGFLKEKMGQAKPLFEEAEKSVEQLQSSASSFIEKPNPNNFRLFFTPLLNPNYPYSKEELDEKTNELTAAWHEGARKDQRLLKFFQDNSIFDFSHRRLSDIVRGKEGSKKPKIKNPLQLLKKRGESDDLERARYYLGLYDSTIQALKEQGKKVETSVAVLVDQVTEKISKKQEQMETPREESKVLEEVSKEEVLVQLEEAWLRRLVAEPLKRIEEDFLAKNSTNPDFSLLNWQIYFTQIKEEYVSAIRTSVSETPRKREDWEKYQEEKQEIDFEEAFKNLGLESRFFDLNYRLSMLKELPNKPFSWLSSEVKEDEIDLRPRQEYLKWVRLLEDFDPESQAWIFPELDLAFKESNDYSLSVSDRISKLWYSVRSIPKGKIESIMDIPAKDLLKKLPKSFDRWPVVKDYLLEKELVSLEKAEAFEKAIINRLTEEVLIAGGYESWPGTEVATKFFEMGTPATLEPLIYYQTLICGASGLYKAGHTNAAAQRALERILRNTTQEEIESLKEPAFVKDALLVLKDIAEADDPIGDDYGRSYLTAGLVARRFSQAAIEIKNNYEDPKYKKWVVALLRGMKNSRQALSEETYNEVLSFLDLDNSFEMQQEVVQMLSHRIHNKEQMGINTRVNEDFSSASKALIKIMERSDFQKSAGNIAAIYDAMQGLEYFTHFAGLSEADVAKIKLEYGVLFNTTIAAPTRVEMETAEYYRGELLKKFTEWIDNPELTSDAKYLILQIFAFSYFDYPKTNEEIKKLYLDKELMESANKNRSLLSDGYAFINFIGHSNKGGYVECLTDLLLIRYLNFQDQEAKNIIIRTFLQKPELRKGVVELFKHWDTWKYFDEYPEQMQSLVDDFNRYILHGSDQEAKEVLNLFSEMEYYGEKKAFLRDLILLDFDLVNKTRKEMFLNTLVRMIRTNDRFVSEEIPDDYPKDSSDLYRYKHETLKKASEKMRYFLDSDNLKVLYWAVYSLDLFNDTSEEFKKAVQNLFSRKKELEEELPGAFEVIDKISIRLLASE